jgi:AraC family transcriptional regulator
MPNRSIAIDDPDRVRALIEDETTLLYAQPQAGPRTRSRLRQPPPAVLDDWRIVEAVRFIERPFDEQPSLEEIAARAELSPHHFQRYFKKAMGESPASYSRRIKLDRAALHLWATEKTVVEIAFMTGYSSHEAFVRAFHAQFGRVPTDYRHHARRSVSLPTAEEIARTADIRLLEYSAMPLIAMRFYGPYANVETHWLHFEGVLRRHGIAPDTCQAVGIAYDSPEIVDNDFIRYDCAIVSPELAQPRAGLFQLSLPQGTYGTLEHHAPYSRIFSTYRVISTAWLPTLAGTLRMDLTCAYEFYRDSPWRNVGGQQRFDLMLPVARQDAAG